MSVQSLLSTLLFVLVILGARAETEVEEEVEDKGPVLEGPSPNTRPYNPYNSYNARPWLGNQGMTRPWLGNQGMSRPWNQPWRPQPRQWSGPMGHVVPSFSGPSQNNGLWQAPPPPIVQQPPFETSGNLEVVPGSSSGALPPIQTVPMPSMQVPPSSQYNPGCGFSRVNPCRPRYNMCGGGGGGGCSSGFNPGMNNGNNGYNPGFVPAANLPAGIEFDNSNGNSGYNPGMNNDNSGYNPGFGNGNNGFNPGYVPASNLPAGIVFDNSNGNAGFNPGMNNGNNGYNPGSYVPAANLPAGIEFDNSNGNSGYNPGGYVPASNLPADIEFDNSGSGNGNSGYNPGCGTSNSYTPLPGRGNCYNVCGRKSQCQVGPGQGYRPPVCRSKCNIQPVCMGGNWNSAGGNSFVCGQNGGGG